MSTQHSELPKLRNIFVGILLCVLFLAVLCSLGDLVKLVGAPFLFIPAQLGLIEQVTEEDVYSVPLASSPTVLPIERPGRYAVFTGDPRLLELATESQDSRAAVPWLKIRSQETGEHVALSFVDRGLRLYDTPVVSGRPIFTFEITHPGPYEIIHPRRDATISIVPDSTTGKEKTIVLAYVLQLLAIALLLGFPSYRRSWIRRQGKKARQRQKREQVEAFWRAERRRLAEKERRRFY